MSCGIPSSPRRVFRPGPARRVGAFVDAERMVTSLSGGHRLCLFAKTEKSWHEEIAIDFRLPESRGIAETKHVLREALAKLDGCEAFVLPDMRGLLRVTMEEDGILVALGHGLVEEALCRAEQEGRLESEEPPAPVPLPVPEGDAKTGVYRIDLLEVLSSGVCHASRDTLLPFLETVPFHRLEILCDHVPRWLDMELAELGLAVESLTKNEPDATMTIVLAPKQGHRSVPIGRRRHSSCGCGG
jgi:Fe-only nitrogenase accessory protein AnfO